METAMEVMNQTGAVLSDYWLQILVAAFLIAMLLYGYRKGLVGMTVSLASLVASFLITKAVMPFVLDYLNQREDLKAAISEKICQALGISQEVQQTESVDAFYQLIGIDRLTDYLGEKATQFVIAIITFLVLLIIVSLFIRIVAKILDLLTKLPLIGLANRVAGAAIGLAEGMFYVWLAIVVIGLLPASTLVTGIMTEFNDPNTWLYQIKQASILTRIFQGMFV